MVIGALDWAFICVHSPRCMHAPLKWWVWVPSFPAGLKGSRGILSVLCMAHKTGWGLASGVRWSCSVQQDRTSCVCSGHWLVNILKKETKFCAFSHCLSLHCGQCYLCWQPMYGGREKPHSWPHLCSGCGTSPHTVWNMHKAHSTLLHWASPGTSVFQQRACSVYILAQANVLLKNGPRWPAVICGLSLLPRGTGRLLNWPFAAPITISSHKCTILNILS